MAAERKITLDGLADVLTERATDGSVNGRLLVGIAGPPGSGKSTCSEMLNDRLNAIGHCQSSVLQMDGYHYDDSILIARGLRPRKGAPDTFDVAGIWHMLDRLKRNEETEIAVPVFDRGLEIARAGARLIPREINVLIVEGNYILLEQSPWSSLAHYFDVTANIRVPEDVLRRRLYSRWEQHGIPASEIPAKVEANDLPNGLLVLANSVKADFILHS